jgi:hypothetical protein
MYKYYHNKDSLLKYTRGIVILFSVTLIISVLSITSINTSLAFMNNNTLNAQLIYQAEGKIIGQKITGQGPQGWKQQVTYQGIGNFSNGGPTVLEYWTFVNTHRPDGVIQGEGNGILNVVNNGAINIHDTITITGHARGYIALNGQYESYPTAQLYTTPLNYNGSLSFLGNVVGIAVWNVYPDLSYNYKLYNMGH